MKRYNTEDENLYLWCCHPEKVCINCTYFYTQTDLSSSWPYDEQTGFSMGCTHGGGLPWRYDLTVSDSKEEFITKLLTARGCDYFELKVGIKDEI